MRSRYHHPLILGGLIASALVASGCTRGATRGGLIGGAGGAIIGSATGLGTAEGAIIGGAAGAVIGDDDHKDRRHRGHRRDRDPD